MTRANHGRNHISIWSPLISAILVGFIFLIVVISYRQSEQKADLRHEQVFWKTFASSYYEWNGSWDRFTEQMTEVINKRGISGEYRIALWNEHGDAIVSDTSVDQSERSPVLATGIIVGQIAVSKIHRFFPAWEEFGAFLSASVTFIICYYTMRRLHREMNRDLQKISKYARRILGDEKIGDLPQGDETIMQSLERLETKIARLEKIRQTMIADIAHELRTPISVIRAQLDNGLASGQPWGPDRLLMLQDEIYRVSTLIKDMQELTIAESDKLRLDKKWFNMTALLELVTETMAMEAEESEIHLNRERAEETLLYADETRIRQIIINLIGNAIKYARTQVSVNCNVNDNHLTIVVQDDGMGMEEEDLPRVFDRFYRGNISRKGLGLGLAIAKEYANAHGGRIEVNSNWGHGSSFALVLPIFHEA